MDAGSITVALGTVALSAAWTSGGQAALQRRVIKQELDLAEQLGDDHLARRMRTHAEERATIYLARRKPSLGAGPCWLTRILVLCVSFVVLFVLDASGISEDSSSLAQWGYVAACIVCFAAVGGVVGSMADDMFRDTRAGVGRARLRYARRRLEEPN
jgi:hypothetical protein